MTRSHVYRALACAALTLYASGNVIARSAVEDTTLAAAGEGSGGAAPPSTSGLDTAPATSINISDATLEKFADAYMAVQEIQKEAGQSASAASSSGSGDLQVKMKAAVEQTGLQVEEFNQIAQQLVSDLDLRARVAEKLQARAGRG